MYPFRSLPCIRILRNGFHGWSFWRTFNPKKLARNTFAPYNHEEQNYIQHNYYIVIVNLIIVKFYKIVFHLKVEIITLVSGREEE